MSTLRACAAGRHGCVILVRGRSKPRGAPDIKAGKWRGDDDDDVLPRPDCNGETSCEARKVTPSTPELKALRP